MYIVINQSKLGKKIYNSILLRESYREDGKVKNRTIANLSNCKPEEIEAIKLALKYKDNLALLGSVRDSVELKEGKSVGALTVVHEVAKELGISATLGSGFAGKLALWQVIARVMEQGSRLSSVRLAQTHEVAAVLGIPRGFDENDLYDNLAWLAKNQAEIENQLYQRKEKRSGQLFLYDVTSSYLEGAQNELAEYGYNRDKKRGKQQIVIGLLCDNEGDPVAVEVFPGNTQDTQTFCAQVTKVLERFKCESAVLVGDRGMIKMPQIGAMPENFHYITAITKPQILSLLERESIQMSLLDENAFEFEDEKARYILRRNPLRAEELEQNRISKQKCIQALIDKKNVYLAEHPKALVSVAKKEVENRVEKLKVSSWLKISEQERLLILQKDEEALREESKLDGCYVIKTDLPKSVADMQTVHDRYKDLALVEQAFRSIKTVNLEVRPVYVRTEENTRGHVLVVMLAYKIIRKLRQAWKNFNLTIEEGIDQLKTICSIEVIVEGKSSCIKIPTPREDSQKLLDALNIRLPEILPSKSIPVVTRKKLQTHRK
jgi:transposase